MYFAALDIEDSGEALVASEVAYTTCHKIKLLKNATNSLSEDFELSNIPELMEKKSTAKSDKIMQELHSSDHEEATGIQLELAENTGMEDEFLDLQLKLPQDDLSDDESKAIDEILQSVREQDVSQDLIPLTDSDLEHLLENYTDETATQNDTDSVTEEMQAEDFQAEEIQAEEIQAEEAQAEEAQAEDVQEEEAQTEDVQEEEVQAVEIINEVNDITEIPVTEPENLTWQQDEANNLFEDNTEANAILSIPKDDEIAPVSIITDDEEPEHESVSDASDFGVDTTLESYADSDMGQDFLTETPDEAEMDFDALMEESENILEEASTFLGSLFESPEEIPSDLELPFETQTEEVPIDIGLSFEAQTEEMPVDIGSPFEAQKEEMPVDIDLPFETQTEETLMDIDLPFEMQTEDTPMDISLPFETQPNEAFDINALFDNDTEIDFDSLTETSVTNDEDFSSLFLETPQDEIPELNSTLEEPVITPVAPELPVEKSATDNYKPSTGNSIEGILKAATSNNMSEIIKSATPNNMDEIIKAAAAGNRIDTYSENDANKKSTTVVNEPSFYNDKSPVKIILLEKEYIVKDWSEILIKVCFIMHLHNPPIVAKFDKEPSLNTQATQNFSYNENDIKFSKRRLPNGLWIETDRTPSEIVQICRVILEICGYNSKDLDIVFNE